MSARPRPRSVTVRRHIRPPTPTQRESDAIRAHLRTPTHPPTPTPLQHDGGAWHKDRQQDRVARTKREGGTTGTRAPAYPFPPTGEWVLFYFFAESSVCREASASRVRTSPHGQAPDAPAHGHDTPARPHPHDAHPHARAPHPHGRVTRTRPHM